MGIPVMNLPRDEDVEADCDFHLSEDASVTYELSDGTTLKVKVDLLYCKRMKQRDPLGQPIYFVACGPPLARVVKSQQRRER